MDRRDDLFAIFARDDEAWSSTAAKAWSSTAAKVTPLHDGDVLQAGERQIEVLHLPGHTAGQSGFLEGGRQALRR